MLKVFKLIFSGLIVATVATLSHQYFPYLGLATGTITFLLLYFFSKGEMGQLLNELKLSREKNSIPNLSKLSFLSRELNKLNRMLAEIYQFQDDVFRKSSATSNQILIASRELSNISEELSKMATLQAEDSQGISSATVEMHSTIGLINKNTANTLEDAKIIESLTTNGQDKINSMVTSVNHTSDIFQDLVDGMEKFKDSSNRISEVIQIIKNVTMQTKLLAFNAAVEAARAGEHGKGFSIVSDEINTLAEKTGESAKEIEDVIVENRAISDRFSEVIKAAQIDIEKTSDEATNVQETFNSVRSKMTQVTRAFDEISVSTSEQTDAIEVISNNLNQIVSASDKIATRAGTSLNLGVEIHKIAFDLEEKMNAIKRNYFTLVPFENPMQMSKKFAPLCDLISNLIGDELMLRLGHDYEQTISEAGDRALITYQTPSTYVEARERFGIIPLVVPLSNGEKFYKTAIVVRKDSGIEGLADIAGLGFAFGDIKSMGSKAMPEFMLKQAGVSLENLSRYDFLGSHDNVAKAVIQGDFKAGGLMFSVAEKFVAEGLKIIATSDQIPQFPICASPKIPAPLREKIIKTLCNIKSGNILDAMGSKITGFAAVTDKDYDIVRKMIL